VKVGDITEITDYQANPRKISAEKTTNEVTWSLAQKVPSTHELPNGLIKHVPQPCSK
jgi:hypothetical protein